MSQKREALAVLLRLYNAVRGYQNLWDQTKVNPARESPVGVNLDEAAAEAERYLDGLDKGGSHA